jgi:hypothetical protein
MMAMTILDNQQLDADNKRVHRRRQNFVRTSVACQSRMTTRHWQQRQNNASSDVVV